MPNGFLAQIGDTSGHIDLGAGKVQPKRKIKKNSVLYADSGIYFYRSLYDEKPSMDTWKMLKSGYSNITHKHADDGSFMLYSKGYEIFTDCGIYSYNKDEFRKYITSEANFREYG